MLLKGKNTAFHHLQALCAAHPSFPSSQVSVNLTAQTSDILIVDNEWIFRFPRYGSGLAQMKKEIALLAALKDRLPLAIPEPLYFHLDALLGQAFMGYRKIRGEPLWRETFQGIHAAKILDRLADQFGAFLIALHDVTPADLPNILSRT
jgi:aminoglycoside 2''-phosphotransferase